jgi:flagellar motor switch protein FliN
MSSMSSLATDNDMTSPLVDAQSGVTQYEGGSLFNTAAAAMTDTRQFAAVPPPSHASMPGSVLKIPVSIQVVIGSTKLPLSQVAQLGPGVMMTLDQKLGTPATILVNGREVARGDIFVLDGEDGRLGITITDVTDARPGNGD